MYAHMWRHINLLSNQASAALAQHCFLLPGQDGSGRRHPDCLFGGAAAAEAWRQGDSEATTFAFVGAISFSDLFAACGQSASASSTITNIGTSPFALGCTGKTRTWKRSTTSVVQQRRAARGTSGIES